MIGIYKITNKINGKSYIGQSIHIEQRWKEHKRNIGSSKNPMYIDFKKYGMGNFSFEVLEECNREDLDNKEIYWIKYYNTFNDGYNLTTGGQYLKKNYMIKENKIEEKRKLFSPQIRGFATFNYDNAQKTSFSTRQLLIYSYLMSISKWSLEKEKIHYYVYKNSFVIKEACDLIGVSQPTWRSALKKLQMEDYIVDYGKYFEISLPNTYAPLDIRLIKFLLPFGVRIKNGGNIVSVYSVIYRYWKHCQDNGDVCEITINQLKKLFKARTDKKTLSEFKIMLDLFEKYGLVLINRVGRVYQGNQYTGYIIKFVSLKPPKEIDLDENGPDDIEDILKAIEESGKNDVE